jgi:hypothetical protein
MFSWSFALSVLAVACSIVAVLISHRSSPSAAARSLAEQAEAVVKKWSEECALFEATRERWSTEFSGIAERCDESLDRAESKRRRVAASESSRNGGGGGAPLTREQILDQARAVRAQRGM